MDLETKGVTQLELEAAIGFNGTSSYFTNGSELLYDNTSNSMNTMDTLSPEPRGAPENTASYIASSFELMEHLGSSF